MKISELIVALECMKQKYGDIIVTYDDNKTRYQRRPITIIEYWESKIGLDYVCHAESINLA